MTVNGGPSRHEEVESERGGLAPEVAEEFPGVGLHYRTIERGPGKSNGDLRARLAHLSSRYSGAQAINLRQQPIPWAYRVFFRHIGLDPDEQPTPVEELVLDRMKRGGFVSANLLDDALTIATVESGVALRVFDADRVTGGLSIRGTFRGEELEGRRGALPVGTLVIADRERPIALLFGATAAERGVSKRTKRMLAVATQVRGVPDIAVEEALWLLVEAVEAG